MVGALEVLLFSLSTLSILLILEIIVLVNRFTSSKLHFGREFDIIRLTDRVIFASVSVRIYLSLV